ncbi:Uncharacterised protein [Mycolicibacterium aurum]|uniref:Secreted protein n=1 Tax=Mycolicibacterium aurum TaxID=1791 RepID=A0A3S4RTK3_MYCAU|nr:hypothetical protein [Mycolicibacterium aurum]VEG58141.1 Uncharacterised protein [Mycolicibacterium aurum]
MNITRIAASALIAFASVAGASAPAFAQPITEDSDAWSCVDMGNRICGPDNPRGVPAGQYDEGGVLIPWALSEVPAWCKDICLGA